MMQRYNFLKVNNTFKVPGKKLQCSCTCMICGSEYIGTLAAVKFNHVASCGCLGKIRFRFNKDIIYGYFDDLNSEDVNYWAGFLFGDGHIDKRNSLKICLTSNHNSPEYLEKLSYYIYDKNKVIVYPKAKRCLLGATNAEMVDNLSHFGITQNKTYNGTLVIPNKNMAQHVIRGYFDADGWFSKRNDKYNSYAIGLCSYKSDNLEIVGQYLPFPCKIYKKSNQHLYYISITKQQSILDFINKFGPVNKNLCFNYKWDKLWNFKQLMLNGWKK